jgi:hypothetical protein
LTVILIILYLPTQRDEKSKSLFLASEQENNWE